MDKTYEEFLADGLDLSPLGFERGAVEAYFCTPRGAEIAGREGVDGVHFCFAPGYGTTLFAVDPTAAAPDFVRAVARDFKDFLRLLLSCGGAAPVEQAHRFTREEFERYIKSARPSAEGQAALSCLRALGIEPIDDPWGYIHALQEGFDYSRIEYTDPGCIAPERPPEGWAVYYGGGFRGRGRGCPGEETPLGARFDWAVRAFMEKWAAADMSGRAARLRAQAENPLECDLTASVCVNGRVLRQKSASGTAWAPLHGLDGDEAARAFVGHYGLDRSCAWEVRRVSFPWPRREDIASLADARGTAGGNAGRGVQRLRRRAGGNTQGPFPRAGICAQGGGLQRRGAAGRVHSPKAGGADVLLRRHRLHALARAAGGRAEAAGHARRRCRGIGGHLHPPGGGWLRGLLLSARAAAGGR